MSENINKDKMQEEKDQKPSGPVLCTKCFQFYGTADSDFLCSKCYKEAKKNQPQEEKEKKESSSPDAKKDKPDEEESKKESKPVQTDTTKCWSCKRKVGLMGISCKCGYTYCSKHRIPEEHDCEFDFKGASYAKDLEKNPQVAPQKMEKIQ